MKPINWTLAVILAAQAGLAVAAPKKMKTDDLSNMIIEGENRLRVKEKAPETTFSPDQYRDISAMVTDESLLLAFKPPAVSEPPIAYVPRTSTRKTASAFLDNILEAPILTLAIKPSKAGEKQVEWLFLVKNSQGAEIYRLRKKGQMPDQIEWDGFDSNRKPLQVGGDYAYSLSIIDEAGNPQHHPGKPFRVDGFRYQSGGRHAALFSPRALFAGDSELKFSKSGVLALVEVKDRLRTLYGKKLEVVVHDDDEKFGLARAQAIRNFLMNELDWAPSKASALAVSLKNGQGYSHVEIIAK